MENQNFGTPCENLYNVRQSENKKAALNIRHTHTHTRTHTHTPLRVYTHA